MAQDKRVFTGGMDKDSDPRLIKNGDYRHAENVRNVASSDGTSGSVENIESTKKVPHNFVNEVVSEAIIIKDDNFISTSPPEKIYHSQKIFFTSNYKGQELNQGKEKSFAIFSVLPDGNTQALGYNFSEAQIHWGSVDGWDKTSEYLYKKFNETTGTISTNIPIISLNGDSIGSTFTAHSRVSFGPETPFPSNTVLTVEIIADTPGVEFLLDFRSSQSKNGYQGETWRDTIDDFPPKGELWVEENSMVLLGSSISFEAPEDLSESFEDNTDDEGNPSGVIDSSMNTAVTEYLLEFEGTEPTTPQDSSELHVFSYVRNTDDTVQVSPLFSFGGEKHFSADDPYPFSSSQTSLSTALVDKFTYFETSALGKGVSEAAQVEMTTFNKNFVLGFTAGTKLDGNNIFINENSASAPAADFDFLKGFRDLESLEGYNSDYDSLGSKYLSLVLGTLTVSGSDIVAEDSIKFPIPIKQGKAYRIEAKVTAFNFSSNTFKFKIGDLESSTITATDDNFSWQIPSTDVTADSSYFELVSVGAFGEGEALEIKSLKILELQEPVSKLAISIKSTTDFNLCFGNSQEDVKEFIESGASLSETETFVSGVSAKLSIEKKDASNYSSIVSELYTAEQEIGSLEGDITNLGMQLTGLKGSYNNAIVKLNSALAADSANSVAAIGALEASGAALGSQMSALDSNIASAFNEVDSLSQAQVLAISGLNQEKEELESQLNAAIAAKKAAEEGAPTIGDEIEGGIVFHIDGIDGEIFNDDFSDGNYDGWQPADSESILSVEDGKLKITNSGTNATAAMAAFPIDIEDGVTYTISYKSYQGNSGDTKTTVGVGSNLFNMSVGGVENFRDFYNDGLHTYTWKSNYTGSAYFTLKNGTPDEDGKHMLFDDVSMKKATRAYVVTKQDISAYGWTTTGDGLEIEGADGLAIGTGYQNTLDIIAEVTDGAAWGAIGYESEGYSDWSLPSRDELLAMYNTIGNGGPQGNIGGFETSDAPYYWSSSESNNSMAWRVSFSDGSTSHSNKANTSKVRYVRSYDYSHDVALSATVDYWSALLASKQAELDNELSNLPDSVTTVQELVDLYDGVSNNLTNIETSIEGMIISLQDSQTTLVDAEINDTVSVQIAALQNIIEKIVSLDSKINSNNDYNTATELLTHVSGVFDNNTALIGQIAGIKTAMDNANSGEITNIEAYAIYTASLSGIVDSYNAIAASLAEAANQLPVQEGGEPQVGYEMQGGVVFYVDTELSKAYVVSETDLAGTYDWGCYGTGISGADGTAIGTGLQNTLDIVSGCSETPTAASEALAYESGGYSDWYLPSRYELIEMYNTIGNGGSEGNIGGFEIDDWPYYWSSSENSDGSAWIVDFRDGDPHSSRKDNPGRVRVIRSFSYDINSYNSEIDDLNGQIDELSAALLSAQENQAVFESNMPLVNMMSNGSFDDNSYAGWGVYGELSAFTVEDEVLRGTPEAGNQSSMYTFVNGVDEPATNGNYLFTFSTGDWNGYGGSLYFAITTTSTHQAGRVYGDGYNSYVFNISEFDVDEEKLFKIRFYTTSGFGGYIDDIKIFKIPDNADISSTTFEEAGNYLTLLEWQAAMLSLGNVSAFSQEDIDEAIVGELAVINLKLNDISEGDELYDNTLAIFETYSIDTLKINIESAIAALIAGDDGVSQADVDLVQDLLDAVNIELSNAIIEITNLGTSNANLQSDVISLIGSLVQAIDAIETLNNDALTAALESLTLSATVDQDYIDQFNVDHEQTVTTLQDAIAALVSRLTGLQNMDAEISSIVETYRFVIFGDLGVNSNISTLGGLRLLMKNPNIPGYEDWSFDDNYIVDVISDTFDYSSGAFASPIVSSCLQFSQGVDIDEDAHNTATGTPEHSHYRVIPNDAGLDTVLRLTLKYADTDATGGVGKDISELNIVDIDGNAINTGLILEVAVLHGPSVNYWEFTLENSQGNNAAPILNEEITQWAVINEVGGIVTESAESLGSNLITPPASSTFTGETAAGWTIAASPVGAAWSHQPDTDVMDNGSFSSITSLDILSYGITLEANTTYEVSITGTASEPLESGVYNDWYLPNPAELLQCHSVWPTLHAVEGFTPFTKWAHLTSRPWSGDKVYHFYFWWPDSSNVSADVPEADGDKQLEEDAGTLNYRNYDGGSRSKNDAWIRPFRYEDTTTKAVGAEFGGGVVYHYDESLQRAYIVSKRYPESDRKKLYLGHVGESIGGIGVALGDGKANTAAIIAADEGTLSKTSTPWAAESMSEFIEGEAELAYYSLTVDLGAKELGGITENVINDGFYSDLWGGGEAYASGNYGAFGPGSGAAEGSGVFRFTTGLNYNGSSSDAKLRIYGTYGKGFVGSLDSVELKKVESIEGGTSISYDTYILGERIAQGHNHNVNNESPIYGTALSNAYNGSAKRMVKSVKTGQTSIEAIVAGGYVCVGSYEDSPKNKIYYFVSQENASRKYDSILEYDLMRDTITTVYQDDIGSSSGSSNIILGFSERFLITGVNKIGDILYWTDNLNRPRKLNVELAKANENNIKNCKFIFKDTYHRTHSSTVFVGGSKNHPFKVGDHIYTQLVNTFSENRGFNGYAKVTGIIPKINQDITFSVTNGEPTITASSTDHGLTSENIGDFIGVNDTNDFPFYYKIADINDAVITLDDGYDKETDGTANPLQLGDGINAAGIITDCPWAGNTSAQSGRMLYAQPKDAYSPLISYGDYSDKVKYFDVIKHQPTYKPLTELELEASIATNNILDNTFQFKYRYKHFDEELTAYSPISDVNIDDNFAANSPINASDYNLIKNKIKVFYNDTVSDVTCIEVVARKGNNGPFFLVDSVPNNFITYLKGVKNSLIAASDFDYSNEETSSKIDFYNNGSYPFVDKLDSDKLFDSVPIKAKAQTILSNNRLAYGNIVEGYDNTEIVASSEFFYDEGVDLTTETTNVNYLTTPTEHGSSDTYYHKNTGSHAEYRPIIDLSGLDLRDDRSQYIEFNFVFNFSFNAVKHIGRAFYRSGNFSARYDVTGITNQADLASYIVNRITAGDFEGGCNKGGSGTPVWSNKSAISAAVEGNGVKITMVSATDNGSGQGDIHATNLTFTATPGVFISGSVGVGSFKTGAFHNFGISYFDETNRCSFVNIAPSYGSVEGFGNVNINGTRCYNKFYSETGGPNLSSASSLNLKIYNKPPEWATHYQLYYTGNTTVDEFIQMTVTDAKPGTDNDKQIYLSLKSLKGENWSYNQANNSQIDYDFVTGDRVRFISYSPDSNRKKFIEYVDLEIAGVDLYTGESEDPITSAEGYFLRINDPKNATVSVISDVDGETPTIDISHAGLTSAGAVDGTGYEGLIVEIYRPKRVIEEDFMVYYEVGDKTPITAGGYHSGDSVQSGEFTKNNQLGVEVSAEPAVITLSSGDIYFKPRNMAVSDNGATSETFFPEDYYLNDFHRTNNYNKGRINVVNNNASARRLETSIYYSEAYSSTGSVNGFSSFNLANSPYFDYNKDFGSIQSLKTIDDDLLVFHENKVGRVLVGKDVLNTASGTGLVSLSTNIINNYVSLYSGDYGCCLQPESVVKFGNKFYFIDIKKGAILRLSTDGITLISDSGMRDYFRDIGEMYTIYDPESQYNQVFNIVAGYDPKYDEYIVTFPAVYEGDNGQWDSSTNSWDVEPNNMENITPKKVFKAKTIAFNERTNRWTSFYNFYPEFYSRVGRQFVGFKAGYLWKHNTTDRTYQKLFDGFNSSSYSLDYNYCYGKLLNSNIEFPFNVEPSSVKSYNTIALESDTKLFTSMRTNIGQTGTGSGNSKGYDDTISTSIGYKNVVGLFLEGATGNIIKGNNDKSKGEVSNFYEDVKKGDTIRIWGRQFSNKKYSPFIRIVKEIVSSNVIHLYSALRLEDVSHIEVIDYKTKEGIQYSQIPFASSTNLGDDMRSSYISFASNSGSGSEIVGLGTSTGFTKVAGEGNYRSWKITGKFDSSAFNGSSVPPNDMILGSRYILSSLGTDGFSILDVDPGAYVGVPGFNEAGANKIGDIFTYRKASTNLSLSADKTDSTLVPLRYKIFSQEISSGKVRFLGNPSKVTSSEIIFSASSLIGKYLAAIPNAREFFIFITKEGQIEGEKMKGSYMMAKLSTSDGELGSELSKYKFNLYSASVDVDKSELSNR